MARRRKHRKHRRSVRHMAHNAPRRHRRRSHKRRYSRRYHRNAPFRGGLAQDLAAAVLAGTLGFAASKSAASVMDRFLPAGVPQRDLVSSALAGAAVIALAEAALKGYPRARMAGQAGAAVPFAWAVLNRTPIGPMLGLSQVVMLPAPAAPAAAPGGISAYLEAPLEEDYAQEY